MQSLALEYKDLRGQKDYFESEVKRLTEEIKKLETRLVDKMIDQGMTSMRLEGVGLLTVSNKLVAKITDKDKFFKWLEDTGRASLIKRDVNYMTLQAFANELGIENEELHAAHENGLDYEEKAILSLRK